VAGSGEHGIDGVSVERPVAQFSAGGFRCECLTLRAGLTHRLVGVRGVEEAPELSGQRAAREWRERSRLAEHAFGDVSLKAEPFPFSGAEWFALVEDRVRDAEPAEVVDEAGSPQEPNVIGRQAGRAPLAPNVSPNKTIEGTIGGSLFSILASFLFLGVFPGLAPWDAGSAIALGVVVAIAAPLGDLCESMIKRDLDIKDMGTLLPGHGGLMDRLDSLLPCAAVAYLLLSAFAPV